MEKLNTYLATLSDDTITNFIPKFEKTFKGYKVIYLTVTGSTLHGTSSEKSDLDYKGIFIPSFEDIVLNKYKKIIKFETSVDGNSADDIDLELFSIFDFFELVTKMESNNLEILFSMFSDKIKYQTEESQVIKENYQDLISSNIRQFVGFAVAMANRYSVKGDRLREVEKFYTILSEKAKGLTKRQRKEEPLLVLEIHKILEENNFEYINTAFAEGPDKKEIEYLIVLGKMYPLTFRVDYVMKQIKGQVSNFGHKTVDAKNNDGVNTKAFAHAFRAIWQAKELLLTGKMSYPVINLDTVKEIKFMENPNIKELSNWMEKELNELLLLVEKEDLAVNKRFSEEKKEAILLNILKKRFNCF